MNPNQSNLYEGWMSVTFMRGALEQWWWERVAKTCLLREVKYHCTFGSSPVWLDGIIPYKMPWSVYTKSKQVKLETRSTVMLSPNTVSILCQDGTGRFKLNQIVRSKLLNIFETFLALRPPLYSGSKQNRFLVNLHHLQGKLSRIQFKPESLLIRHKCWPRCWIKFKKQRRMQSSRLTGREPWSSG